MYPAFTNSADPDQSASEKTEPIRIRTVCRSARGYASTTRIRQSGRMTEVSVPSQLTRHDNG